MPQEQSGNAVTTWYCDMASGHPEHGPYHDSEYGFPMTDEQELFERLCLEIFQAGLSWLIVLKKRPALRDAFRNFDVDGVATFTQEDIERLMADSGIIRNRLKIESIIENARRLKAMRKDGGFADWLAAHHPRSKDEWVKLFKKTFKFTGGEIVGEFLTSIGILPGAHRPDCPVYAVILERSPLWAQQNGKA